MSSATASDVAVPLLGAKYHFLLRRLHSLTGLVFGGYLVVHLIVNATLAQMGAHDIYQVQVAKIHELPFLWAWEWGLIYLPILFHTVYGIYIALAGQPNVDRYKYAKNWFYVLQRISAVIILLFMIFHIFALKAGWFGVSLSFDPQRATGTVGRHMQAHWFIPWIIYPLGILASCFHLANGFWTAAVTWGLTVSAGAQRRWGYVCAGLFVVTLLCGIVALVTAAQLDWRAAMIRH
ncbi:MAG: succinate dehydrogenase [Phycisphaerales bacterium]|nr:succinate dehydrogenase [Phycisphaerales bacterium]